MSDKGGEISNGWIGLRRLPSESELRAVLITLIVCMVCSAAIALSVTVLRPYREANRAAERQSKIREMIGSVPGLEEVLGPTDDVQLEARIVDLETGRYAEDIDVQQYDPRESALDSAQSVAIPSDEDIAGLGRRAKSARVYLVSERGRLRLVVLPVEGAGYISRLRGYLALDADLRTIRGLSFYEHAETPGLGSEIDSPAWRALWPGKKAFDDTGRVRIVVVRGRVDSKSPDARFQVDGISGATRTSDGVTHLLRFWLGPFGFGPYLDRLAESSGDVESGSLE
jgi:Na+-transporting NADH:ubiquinone oxidoreductase subunit C